MDNPNTPAQLAPAFVKLNDQDLIDAIVDVRSYIGAEDEKHDNKMREFRMELRQMEAHLQDRMIKVNAYALPHPRYTAKLVSSTKIDKRIDVLRELESIVPQDELRKGLCLVQPEPEWKADARYLMPLAKKYGDKVRDILDRGLVKVVVGSVRLMIEEKKLDTLVEQRPLSEMDNVDLGELERAS